MRVTDCVYDCGGDGILRLGFRFWSLWEFGGVYLGKKSIELWSQGRQIKNGGYPVLVLTACQIIFAGQ